MFVVMGILCYVVGSIPTAYLLAKLVKGVDIRTVGSGNVGATNALRTLGVWAGVTVFAVDLLKGVAAARLVPLWVFGEVSLDRSLMGGLLAVLGHDFPCCLGFRGGKGVATTIGVLVGGALPVAGVVLATWVAVFALTRYVSIGSLAAAAAIPLSQLWLRHSPSAVSLGGMLALLIIIQHRSNLRRLLAGTEHRARSRG